MTWWNELVEFDVSGGLLGRRAPPGKDANNGDVAHGGPGGDEGDSHSLMQLTREEEVALDDLGVDDDLRRSLRDLLHGLQEQEKQGRRR